jgi:hypothetical protein
MVELGGLPGSELVAEGLADLAAGRDTVPALLVAVAGARLRRLGLPVPIGAPSEPERRLYRALADEDPASAHARYNSLLRRVDKLARALEREEGRALRMARR